MNGNTSHVKSRDYSFETIKNFKADGSVSGQSFGYNLGDMRSGKGPGFSGEGKIDRGNEETKTTDGKTTSKSWNQREGKFESVKSEHNGELKFDQLFNDAIKYRDHLRSENQKSLDEKSASDNDARQQGNGNTESEKGAGSSGKLVF